MFGVLVAVGAFGQETPLVLEGEVPPGEPDHFRIPFEVPEGVVEIEVRHDDLSEANILDWGLDDPAGWRGWGGGNSEPAVVGVDAASRSYVPGPIAAGTWSVVVGKAKILETPARYHVEIVLRTTPTLPAQPERQPYADVPALEVGERWYAGDFHVHSRESGDASATLDEIADLARSRGLDFVVLTDHNTVTQADFILDAQARHPDLLFVPGTEFTTYGGHATAIGATGWVDHKLGQPGVSIESAAAAYEAQGALLSVNHPVLDLGDLCIGCAWDEAVPPNLAGVEIQNGGWEPTGVLFTLDAIAWWEQLLDQGQRPAALGGSDDHRAGTDTGPFASPIGDPTTLVWAPELSVPALIEGIRAQRTVVKLQDGSDPMVEVAARGPTVTAKVTGGVGAELVWVVDGQSEPGIPIDADPFEAALEAGEGGRVRAEVWGSGHPRTVTSHVWPEAVDSGGELPDGPGCGCGSAPGGGGVTILAFLAFVRRIRPVR